MINIEGFINNLVTCLVAPLLELSVHRVQTTEWGRIFIKLPAGNNKGEYSRGARTDGSVSALRSLIKKDFFNNVNLYYYILVSVINYYPGGYY